MTFAAGAAVRVAARQHAGPPPHARLPEGQDGHESSACTRRSRTPRRAPTAATACPSSRSTSSASPQRDVWPDQAASQDRIYADVFEHWLEAAE